MAILVLLVLSMLATVLMMNIPTERKIGGHEIRSSQALIYAESGIAEALSRIQNGDINLPASNPRSVGQIFLAPGGSVPVLGPDSTAVGTKQPAGQWLGYSTSDRSADALTVKFKTNPARTTIYRYDATKSPPVQTASGSPIYVVTATGIKGPDKKRIVAEYFRTPINVFTRAAVTSNCFTEFLGGTVICGYDHAANTPSGTGDNGRPGIGGCNENPGLKHWELGTVDLPGGWSTDRIKNVPGSLQYGTPASTLEYQPGPFFSGPWDVLGMTKAEFNQFVGPPQATTPADLNGVFYLDDNGTPQDRSGNFALNGMTGSGLLYVDGDLTLNGTLNYRGLIYVEGKLIVNAQAWILGGVLVNNGGGSVVKLKNNSTVLYSRDAIEQNISSSSGSFVRLSWREVQ